MPSAKSTYLRVGGSAWELNIDTKRLQDKQNKHLEDDSEKWTDKNTQLWQYEAPKKCLT